MTEPAEIPIETLKNLLELRQLRMFHAASSERSLRDCAIKHGINQSSLTRSIHALEESLGVRLFDKSRRGIVLTGEGQLLLERTRKIFDNLAETQAAVRTLKSNVTGRVRLAVPATLSSFLLPPLLGLYADDLKTTRLSILEGSARHISQWLKAGEVDVGIIVGRSTERQISSELLYGEELYLIGKTSPESAVHGVISIADLANLPLVLPLLPLGSRQILEDLAASQGVRLQAVVEVDSPSIQKLLVLRHGLFSVFSRLVCQEELRSELVHATKIHPSPKREFYIATRAGQDLSPATRFIYHLLRRVGQRLNDRIS